MQLSDQLMTFPSVRAVIVPALPLNNFLDPVERLALAICSIITHSKASAVLISSVFTKVKELLAMILGGVDSGGVWAGLGGVDSGGIWG